MARVSPHIKLLLNPSAPDFSPDGFSEPVKTMMPLSNSTEPQNIPNKPLIAVWEKSFDGTDMAQPVDFKCLKPQRGTQISSSPAYMQQRLERLVYFATRDYFMRSPFNLVNSLTAKTAAELIKCHIDPSHLKHFLRQYKMNDLVETMIKMHAEHIYISTPDTIKKNWPWLLDGDISELAMIGAGVPQKKTEQSNRTRPTSSMLKNEPNNTDSGKGLSPNSFLNIKNPKLSSTYTRSVLDDDPYSVMSFDPSGEVPRDIDPDNIYFPYPTLRAILKETRRILKAAFYEFTKRYLPEKLIHRAFEFPDNSSLGQIILMVQDTIDDMDSTQFPEETLAKLMHLRELDSNTSCLNSASELYYLVSRRRDVSISVLFPLLTKVLDLIDALGVSDWSKKQRALNKYTSVLATEIKQKFEEIQGPIRTTLERINNQRKALAAEEELITQKYRKDEKEIQRHFILDAETLRGIIHSQRSGVSYPNPGDTKGSGAHEVSIIESPTPQASVKPKRHTGSGDIETPKTKNCALLTPPDICVWDPQKQLIDYRPSGSQLQPGTQDGKPGTRRRPWDVASIDLAFDELNSKGNTHCAAKKNPQNIPERATPNFQAELRRHILEVVVPSKHNKAIPIRKIEGATQKPKPFKKAEPMPKYNPYSLESGKSSQETDLLIDL
ncbi:hypothetical protein TWF506_005537 [Arthrobotrys conoides]|uniref:Uncharacterized protein n=1 Tax=Arthrobotrys conoides TaxID=74498 RepID=A0AAN8NJG3_9PEZI